MVPTLAQTIALETLVGSTQLSWWKLLLKNANQKTSQVIIIYKIVASFKESSPFALSWLLKKVCV
jgi:hypothetical protein